MEFLRTPDEHFEDLPDYDFEPHYLDLSNGARLHYIDTQEGDECIVMLHGEPSWSFLYRHVINELKGKYRCIAPDLLGFGRSDKPIEIADHSFDFHYQVLAAFLIELDLTNITLVVQDWGGILGLPLAIEYQDRIKRLVIMNTGLGTGDIPLGEGFMAWQNLVKRVGRKLEPGRLMRRSFENEYEFTDEIATAYDAPFPDASYRAGVAAMPLLVPSETDMGGAERSRAAREAFKSWDKPTLVMFSDQDPVTRGVDRFFRKLIPTAQNEPEITIEGAGHFLQEEKGAEIAEYIAAFIERNP